MATFSQEIQQITARLHSLIETVLPDPVITVDGQDTGLGIGTGYKGLIFVITPFPGYVRLGIAGGAALADPAGLLEGSGKVHRHIKIRDQRALEDPALLVLMKEAVAAKLQE